MQMIEEEIDAELDDIVKINRDINDIG